jgi:hypothetical protein
MSPRVRLGPALLSLAALLLLLAAPTRRAHAWVEAHVEADDIRVILDRTGAARIEHRITLKIAGGPLRTLDLRGVDKDATPDPDAYLVPHREAAANSLANAVPITADPIPGDGKLLPDGSPAPPVLRLRLGEKGVSRGVYVVFMRYTTRLGARIKPDGGLTRVEWRGPTWDDGFDSARVTFELPAAPTEPRAADPAPREGTEPGAPAAPREALVLTKVRRGVAKDEIELYRPYVPKGEAITWAIRVDARALAPPAPPARPAAPELTGLAALSRRGIAIGGGLLLFAAYALLVGLKAREVARAAAAAGVTPRPFVPLGPTARALLAGAAIAGGVFVQIGLGRATLGALLVLGATALAAHRAPIVPRRATLRGPGRWLPVADEEAFREPPRPTGAWLDVSTRAGKAIFAALVAGVLGGAFALAEVARDDGLVIAFDLPVLLAIFGTGRLAELPPDPARAPARRLRDVARRVRRALAAEDVRVVGKIRVPDGSAEPDELRLAIAPKGALPGFGVLEVGVVYASGGGGWIGLPEVLLRVAAGSACERALEGLARAARRARGRKPSERVLAFTPRMPTARMTAALVVRLARAVQAAEGAAGEETRARVDGGGSPGKPGSAPKPPSRRAA